MLPSQQTSEIDPWSLFTAAAPTPWGRERRRYKRLEVRLPGLLTHGGQGFDCDVLDVSANGAQVSCVDELPPGTLLCLRVGHLGPLQCAVVWHEADRMGLKFTATPRAVVDRMHGLLPDEYCTQTDND